MHVVVDEKGRIEIPQELHERFDFNTGTVVDVEPGDRGIRITVATNELASQHNGQLVLKEGVLIYQHEQSATDYPDIVDVIDQIRHERMEHIAGFPLDRS